jgi:acetyl esterase/lipase
MTAASLRLPLPESRPRGLASRLVRGVLRRVNTRIRIALRPAWIHAFTSAYGPDPGQQLDVLQPRWPRHEKPLVVVFHGGGWSSGSRASMMERVCRRYLVRGFTVVNVGYRYGLVRASEDAVRALDWVMTETDAHGADPGRVFVTGESAGAHLALLAALPRPRIRGVINFYAVTDLTVFPHARADDSVPTGDLEATLRRLSPLELVRPDSPPVLSIHGTADDLVPLEHTSRLTRRLRQTGVAAEEIIVEGGGHGFPEPWLDAIYARVFRHLARPVSRSAQWAVE